ncbi:MAG: CDP-alcohol phosphatidyltransferase family protein, partial [Verrucomicrobiota bacterium]
MVEYKPTSRRPIAQTFRQTADAATRLCVRSGIQADTISYSSMVSALAAALCFWKSSDYAWLLIVAPLFCLFRLWLNMLDGMVAIAAGQASTRGE